MRWQLSWQSAAAAIVVFMGGLFLGSRLERSDAVHTSAAERLQPAAAAPSTFPSSGTVYVPVYSSLDLGFNRQPRLVDLAATVSVRNVSPLDLIVIESVRYFDSTGKLIRSYLEKPSELPPLNSVEFVVQRSDTAGGPGANFLIRWNGPEHVDTPLVEAVMLGQAGGAGISFTSPGRAVE
jgi:hypothetical protein